jgi:kynureninase
MPHAARVQRALRKQNIWTDYRGDMLRLGPAPYVTNEQLQVAVQALHEEG